MKNLSFFTLLILIILISNLRGQWEILNEGGSYRSIDFINDQVGWIAGDRTLLKTIDGGETWESVSMDSARSIRVIDFVNETVGWAGTNDYQIIKTMDGGHTWCIQKELISNDDVRSDEMVIHAVNDTILHASIFVLSWVNSSDLLRILKTEDGGTNWMDISPVNSGRTIKSICFHDTRKGIFIGNSTYEPLKGIILKTKDGGKTWDETKVPEFTMMYDLQFINDSTAYFLATRGRPWPPEQKYFLCATTDTLNSWSVVYELPYHQNSSINSFYCLDDRTIFAIMTDSTGTSNFMKSIDGGLTWEKKQIMGVNILYNNYDMYFNNTNVGFMVYDQKWPGRGGSFFFNSIDGGENWIIQKMNYPSIKDIYSFDKNSVVAAGDFAYECHSHGCLWQSDLFFTNDGGKTWEWGSFIAGGLNSCFFLDQATWFISIYSRFSSDIYKTRDAGKNWTEVFVNDYDSTGFVFGDGDISFINEKIGWAIGSIDIGDGDITGAAILGTKDGGENWNLVWKYQNTDEGWHILNSIKAIGEEAWVVGEYGMILKYTEQDQWQVQNTRTQNSITDLPLNKVFFSDENHGWIAGGYFDEDNVYLKLFKTTDGGETWQENNMGKFQINDMYFESNLNGWAVGTDTSYHGMILETMDGGDNWNIQIKDLSAPLNAIHFKDGYGWAVGDNGLVLRTDGTSWVDQNTDKTYPNKFSLSQNYPNPFNPKTIINYELQITNYIELSIYNLLGQKVASLVSKKQPAGIYQVEWDASAFASGIYYYKIEAGEFQDVKKMVLLK